MNPDSKRLLTAMLVCLLVLMAWTQLSRKLFPPPPPKPQPAAQIATTASSESIAAATPEAAATPATRPAGVSAASAALVETPTLGINAPRADRDGKVVNPF